MKHLPSCHICQTVEHLPSCPRTNDQDLGIYYYMVDHEDGTTKALTIKAPSLPIANALSQEIADRDYKPRTAIRLAFHFDPDPTRLTCEKCGSPAHRDDAMNRRCNSCEHLVRQCICLQPQPALPAVPQPDS